MQEQMHITALLNGIRHGDQQAEGDLIDFVYTDLRKIAHHFMAGERKNHTLQPTAIVHEAFVRIFRGAPVDWRDRAHFMAVAASQMRRVLIDYGRAFRAGNRGGDMKVPITDALVSTAAPPCDIQVIDDLLQRLQKADPDAAKVIELKFFTGLTDKEIAEVLHTSHSTVRRHWMFARAWMSKHLSAA